MTVQEQIKTLKTRQNSLARQIENKPTYTEMCRICDEQAKLSEEITVLKRYLMFI